MLARFSGHSLVPLGHERNMATGRSKKIVGQTGEYLVAAELSRRGLIATTFTGNVPHYDIIASDETGRHVSVQVKSSRSASWQFVRFGVMSDLGSGFGVIRIWGQA